MSGAPLLTIAAGGTGGHMFPAQALAEEMLSRGWRVSLMSDARGLGYAKGFPAGVAREEVQSATFARGGLRAKLTAPLAIFRGIREARARFAADPPACVAGFGGYPALPALTAAWTMKLPSLIHEQNAVLGRVNRIFATRVDRVCCGSWPLMFPPKGAELVHVGNPVRSAVLGLVGEPFLPPGEGTVRLLVFGGSQGASVFARLVPQAVAMLPEGVRARLAVTQQVRAGEEGAVAEAYRSAGVEAGLRPFFDDMPERIVGAHLVVARAGASTIAELTAIGRPAILVPYPHAMDDHQTANAQALESAGGAIVAQEADLTAEALARHLGGLLGSAEGDARLAAMAEKAEALGRPGAAGVLGDIVQALGGARAG